MICSLGGAVCGGHVFNWGTDYRSDGSRIWVEGASSGLWGRSPPEAEAFTLNYTFGLF